MQDILESTIFLAFDVILFTLLVTWLVSINSMYQQTEKNVVEAVSIKNNLTTTYEDMEDPSQNFISGTAVANEILTLDSNTVTVYINNTNISRIPTKTGDSFIEYVKKYDSSPLYREVSVTNQYLKKYLLNTDGELVGIRYLLVN